MSLTRRRWQSPLPFLGQSLRVCEVGGQGLRCRQTGELGMLSTRGNHMDLL